MLQLIRFKHMFCQK